MSSPFLVLIIPTDTFSFWHIIYSTAISAEHSEQLKRDAKKQAEVEKARSAAQRQAEDVLSSERGRVKAGTAALRTLQTQYEAVVGQLKKQTDLLLEAKKKNEEMKTSNEFLVTKMEEEMLQAEQARENERTIEAERLKEIEKEREAESKRLIERESEINREREMEREKEKEGQNERGIEVNREREREVERERERERSAVQAAESAQAQAEAQAQDLEKENQDLKFRLSSLESELIKSLSSPLPLSEDSQPTLSQPSSSEEYEELLAKMQQLTAQCESSSALSKRLEMQVAALEDEKAKREEAVKREALSLR
jgi:myosin heavy subunit